MVSVIMSVYKEPVEWLKESIDSILNQSFSDFELIIVNDCPARNENRELLLEYKSKDKRIFIIENEINIGLTKSLNKALSCAKGKYIARMDSDDISRKERLLTQVQFMEEHPDIDVCGCNIKAFGDSDKAINYPEDMSQMYLYLDSPFAHPAVIIRKSSISGYCYDESYRYCQDYELWSRLYWKGAKFHNIQDILLDYRYSTLQIMSQNNHNQILASMKIRKKNLQNTLWLYNKNYTLGDTISIKNAYEIPQIIKAPKEVKQKLRYYLYLSVKTSLFLIAWNLVCSGDVFRLNSNNLMHVIYYRIKNVDQTKF